MKDLKTLLMVLLTTAASMAVAAPASANPLTSPSGTAYTGTIKAESVGATVLDSPSNSYIAVSCKSSIAEGNIETHSARTAGGKLSSLTFNECHYPVSVLSPGSLEIHATGGRNGRVTSTGAEITVETSAGDCRFTTAGTEIGTLTGSNGTNATLDLQSASIPRTGGSAGLLCGPAGAWTGSYKIVTPSTLSADLPPAALTSPAGTPYTGTINAEAGATTFSGSFFSFECSHSTLQNKIESHTESKAEGKLSNFTFEECNWPVTVLKPGSLAIHAISGGNGTVTSTGAEIEVQTSFGKCILTTNATDIGTLTGSSSSSATIDVSSVGLPRTGGSGGAACGSAWTWNGSYQVTTPSTLYADLGTSPLISPAGAYYTSTIKAESESAITLSGSFVTVDCKKSTLQGKVESHTATTAGGKLGSLTFGECNFPLEVVKPGSLELHATSSGNATTTSAGAEIKITTSVGECVFTTTNTDIGTFTGSSNTNATIDMSSAGIPRTGGSGGFLCGSSGTLNGSYKITTPSTLYMV